MPFNDLAKLRDHAEYKKILKTELGKVKGTPIKFQLFDKFKFEGGKLAPLMVVGTYSNDFIDDIKHGGAVFKAKGRCAEKAPDADLEFTADQGTLPPTMLKTAMVDGGHKGEVVEKLTAGDAGKAEVLSEPKADSEQHTGPGGSKGDDPKKAAERRFAEVTKLFDGVKGKFEAKQRDATRALLEHAAKRIAANDLGVANETLAAAEAQVQKEVLAQKLSIAKTGAEVDKAVPALQARVKKIEADILAAGASIDALADDLKKNGRQRSGEKFKDFETRLARLKKRVEEETQKLTDKKAGLAEDLKSATGPELAQLKELIGRFMGLSKRSEELSRAAEAATVGELGDDADLAHARDDVKPGVGKMAEASGFLKGEHERAKTDPNMHGSGRHGAQGGLDRGAARVATKNDMRPDSPTNRDGVTQHIKQWNKVELEWEDLPDGKRKLKDKTLIAKTVLAEVFPGENPTGNTSMFLNPILEKEAVDQALEVAKRCVWKYRNNASNTPVLELGMVVGKPATAPGWGYAISKIPGVQKKTVAEASALLTKFEKGDIDIDELCDQLNVQIKTDRTGAGALLVPFSTVVLVRKTVNDPWTSKTHYPDDRKNAASWEIEGMNLRKLPNGPAEVVPAL